jgi:hypothetical protein
MDIASGSVAQVLRTVERLGARHSILVLKGVILALIGVALALAVGVLIGDHLLPASEPLIAAPFRW